MSTIESAVYENRTYGAVRGRGLVTPSYSIVLYDMPVLKFPLMLIHKPVGPPYGFVD